MNGNFLYLVIKLSLVFEIFDIGLILGSGILVRQQMIYVVF